MKYTTLVTRYVLENNFTAYASVELINSTGTFFTSLFDCSPTIIFEGYRLSYSAFPYVKNSSENIMLSVSNISLAPSISPTVQLILLPL